MVDPTTPRKQVDKIRDFKGTISARWGLKFLEEEALSSPSTRDRKSIAVRVDFLIGALCHREGALEEVLEQFTRKATEITTEWQYKPRADTAVLPMRGYRDKPLTADFLHRQPKSSGRMQDDLMETLESKLNLTYQSKIKKTSRQPDVEVEMEESAQAFCKTRSGNRGTVYSPSPYRRQSGRLISKAQETSQGKSQITKAYALIHAESPSSLGDDLDKSYKADDEDAKLNEAYAPKLRQVVNATRSQSPAEDAFSTPPESPLKGLSIAKSPDRGREAFKNDIYPDVFRKPDLPAHANRKRPSGETHDSLRPRKVSRDNFQRADSPTYGETGYRESAEPINYNSNHLDQEHKSKRKTSIREQFRQSAEAIGSALSSMTSSFTSAASVATSPNTSFSMASSATSVDSSAEETDSTLMPVQIYKSHTHRSFKYKHDASTNLQSLYPEIAPLGSEGNSPQTGAVEIDGSSSKESKELGLKARLLEPFEFYPLPESESREDAILHRLEKHSPFGTFTLIITNADKHY